MDKCQKNIFSHSFCSLAIVLINIQKSPSFLVALFAVYCIIFIKTSPKCVVSRTKAHHWWLYPNRTTLCVFSTVFCTFRLDFIIFFCWYLTKNALVDPEFLGREICAERFEQLASVINFRVYDGKIRPEM